MDAFPSTFTFPIRLPYIVSDFFLLFDIIFCLLPADQVDVVPVAVPSLWTPCPFWIKPPPLLLAAVVAHAYAPPFVLYRLIMLLVANVYLLFFVNWVYDKTGNKETFVVTRPKPPYGRQGLAGSWGKHTNLGGLRHTFWFDHFLLLKGRQGTSSQYQYC